MLSRSVEIFIEAFWKILLPGLTITIPELAQVRTNVTGFNPYHKYGKGNGSRLVISVPLSEKNPVRQLIFSEKKATGTTPVHAEKKISQKNI